MTNIPKNVLITGATSDFGMAMARRFAAAGSQLILHGRNAEKLRQLADSLPGVKTHIFVADFSDMQSVEKEFAKIPASMRPISLLINNAGGALGLDKMHELDLKDADAMLDANCRALVYMTRLATPDMVAAESGHVIHIGSTAAHWPYPGGNVYAACKAFTNQLALSMRCDLQNTGVRVTVIEPGLCETSFSLKRFKGDADRAAKVYENTKPLTADDVAECVFWAATLPQHVNINSIEVMPTAQSWAGWSIERKTA